MTDTPPPSYIEKTLPCGGTMIGWAEIVVGGERVPLGIGWEPGGEQRVRFLGIDGFELPAGEYVALLHLSGPSGTIHWQCSVTISPNGCTGGLVKEVDVE